MGRLRHLRKFRESVSVMASSPEGGPRLNPVRRILEGSTASRDRTGRSVSDEAERSMISKLKSNWAMRNRRKQCRVDRPKFSTTENGTIENPFSPYVQGICDPEFLGWCRTLSTNSALIPYSRSHCSCYVLRKCKFSCCGA